MNLKSIMLSERNEAQKAIWFHLYEMPGIDKAIETESGLVVARDQEEGGVENDW